MVSRQFDRGAFSGLSDTLESLSIYSNKLETISGDSFDGLSLLKKLELGNNQLKIVIPAWFSQLPALEYLDIGENQFETIPDKTFSQLTNLEILAMYQNKFETIPEDAFEGLNKLKKLVLHEGNLKTLSFALVENKPHLELLQIFGNPLECDCRLAWVRTMADILNKIPFAGYAPLCASPPPVKGTPVVAYNISMCAATTTETGIS